MTMGRYLWLRQIQGEMATRMDTSRRAEASLLNLAVAPQGHAGKQRRS
jgi:hypothetical protein